MANDDKDDKDKDEEAGNTLYVILSLIYLQQFL